MKDMKLFEKRTELGLTQTEVARKVGASLSSYRLWEAGVTTPKPKNLEKLKKVLRLNIE